VSYNVLGLTDKGIDFKLITGFEFWAQASYIEQEVEKYLGIENEEVNGEHEK
jgi:hypothetical protein